MGVVWRATDTSLGRDVAVKVLPEAFARDPDRMARFEREARVLASLNHPNIAAIYGVGSADGVRFLAMELVTGDDLATRLEHGPVPVVETLQIARQIAEGLEAAHEKGVIHRDLKPANVKVTPDGNVKVLDFGLAKALEGEMAPAASAPNLSHSPTLTSPMTAAHVILGTAAYMSPEQARGKPVDRRADIWAFGCLVLECLTGQRAFDGETVSDTLAKILEREPDLKALPGGTPARVRDLIQRCLIKDPKLRLRDIGDARIVLEEVLAARTSSGRLLVKDEVGSGATPRRLRPGVIAAVGAIGVVIGAGVCALVAPHLGGEAGEPTCVTLTMPPGITVQNAGLTPDGRTLVVRGQPQDPDGSGTARPMVYTRRLDSFEFKPLPGTEGVVGFATGRKGTLYATIQVSPASPALRAVTVPLDGSSPPTTLTDWKDSWSGGVRLSNGDLLIREGDASFVRMPVSGGTPSPAVRMDAGRAGVSRFEFTGNALPGDQAALVNVVSYDTRGWHYSVGVVDTRTGKVKVVEEDGGNALYSPTGHLLFSRGDAILAAPFDAGKAEVRGAPVAVWSGLSTNFTFVPGAFSLTDAGGLFYRPGQVGGDRSFAILDAGGSLTSWSAERRPMDSAPVLSPDGRHFACTMVNARGIDEAWVSPVDHADFRRLGTDPNADCFWMTWSPDGGRLAYYRNGKDGKDGIYIQDVDGGPARRILAPESDQVTYQTTGWLPDGSAVVATRTEAGRFSLVAVPIPANPADTSQPRPMLQADFNRGFAFVAPGGRMIAFYSQESGNGQVMVAELHADGSVGRPVRVSPLEAQIHLWGTDDRTLYVQDVRNRLLKFSVTPGPQPTVSGPAEVGDLEKLRIQFWTPLPGGRVWVGLKNENEYEITRYNLVLNWTDLLKRKMRAAR
jgi:serine/threonine-protein kinase